MNAEKQPLSPAQLKKRRNTRNTLARSAVQVLFFVSMPGAFVAGFNGVKEIFQRIGSGSVIEPNAFILALVGLCAFTVVFGRYFCGFVCAFGSFGDFVFWLSGIIQKKLFKRKKQYVLPEAVTKYARYVKYAVLAVIVSLCALGVYSRLGGWSPWSVFSFLTSFRLDLAGYALGAVLLVLIIAGMSVKERFFCQFLCPMGAVFSLLPILPFAQLRRDTENCIPRCNACKMKCPVDIKLEQDGFLNGECIACERCTGVCPRANLTRWDRKLLKDELIPVLIKAVLFFALGSWLGLCRWF